MDYFCNCSSLISLPDISKWNINNLNDLSLLFCNCSSLISLPDISKWNIDNVNDLSGLFYNCSSLIYCLIYLIGILRMLKVIGLFLIIAHL